MDALAILRDDAKKLPPHVARAAQGYILSEAMALPDVWRSALLRTLEALDRASPAPEHEETVPALGAPGAWSRNAYSGEWVDLRLWLAAVQALAAGHAPASPAQA